MKSPITYIGSVSLLLYILFSKMPATAKPSSSSIAPNVRRAADVKMPIRVTDGGKDQRYVHLQICKDNGARDMRTVAGFLRK